MEPYAGVREQFGQRIGAFQAVKHLCAEMLETSESVTAAAWDAAVALDDDPEQAMFATEVAATTCFDGAVEVAKTCIQVLGGIGFTFEHDAHLYLRRAIALRALVGDPGEYAGSLARRAASGVRRTGRIDFGGQDEEFRGDARAEAARVAHELLSSLDEEKRVVLLLAELEEMPAAEIARGIGVNVNTVYARLRAARQAFSDAVHRHHARIRGGRNG